MKNVDVICSGLVTVDHIAAPIERLPNAGELLLTDECFLALGGCGCNVAVDLSKMGVPNAMCGLVGDDYLGRFARAVLEEANVDVTHLAVTKKAATSQTLIVNVQGQDRRFIHHMGANGVVAGADFPRDAIRNAKILYLGGYFVMDGLLPEELADVFRDAQSAGVKTIFDVVVSAAKIDPDRYVPALKTILPFVDVFLPNADEGKFMTGRADSLAQAELFRELGAKTVVVTSGGYGSVLLSPTHRVKANVYKVKFVDGTGGGDAFDAGYICGLLEGADPIRCLKLGSALGASCVQKSGATAGVFRRDQCEAFIAQNELIVEDL